MKVRSVPDHGRTPTTTERGLSSRFTGCDRIETERRSLFPRLIVRLSVADNDGLALLAHELLHVVRPQTAFPGAAGGFPASKRLASGPGPGSRAALAIRIHDTGFDAVEECSDLFPILAKDTRSQTVVGGICLLDRLVDVSHRGDDHKGQKDLLLEELVVEG